ncbi:LL-diaminopimelate aminotransferase [Verrucomicrobiaceae bacterium 5K15]|uniref:LL-diaminopimelate aminotransferase n=1 Tax=Oceaniferula flava TaxID=2800421 RepID=A0AAE2SFA2_9BACT|nr:LL-diaminopimelate aminotransferase [Oceaniferula flavus]MBK1855276.1 LL-diaminopimelate aminotransferase [Oceaniferula flavus]MBM1136582.1 LL-diaminopimelate aminotransferase [Oceaniferula flavus]
MNINENFLKLKAGYLFPEIGRRVTAWTEANPDKTDRLIRCGIGDVTEPLPQAVRDAMHAAIDEQGVAETFHGYGPEQGYGFLRDAIVENQFEGLNISADEVFVSDGSKCDTGNILDIFGKGNKIAITDPVYPVYVDTNVMAGNTGEADENGAYEGLVYLPCTAENNFVPAIPEEKVDLVYLCYPNNPTGTTATREQLESWVAYAKNHGAIILYDAAYEAFVRDSSVPRSIFEIEGAHECAIEFRSFSKNGGFTGVRCAYTVIPKTLTVKASTGEEVSLHSLWNRRQSTKFNGASYPVQRGAAAVFSPEGKEQVSALIEHYMGNAALLRKACQDLGLKVFGGENAPYVWVQCPEGVGSWDMFDKMLEEAQVVITPGAGFGAAGEGYFRISSFNTRENVEEVCKRIAAIS